MDPNRWKQINKWVHRVFIICMLYAVWRAGSWWEHAQDAMMHSINAKARQYYKPELEREHRQKSPRRKVTGPGVHIDQINPTVDSQNHSRSHKLISPNELWQSSYVSKSVDKSKWRLSSNLKLNTYANEYFEKFPDAPYPISPNMQALIQKAACLVKYEKMRGESDKNKSSSSPSGERMIRFKEVSDSWLATGWPDRIAENCPKSCQFVGKSEEADAVIHPLPTLGPNHIIPASDQKVHIAFTMEAYDPRFLSLHARYPGSAIASFNLTSDIPLLYGPRKWMLNRFGQTDFGKSSTKQFLLDLDPDFEEHANPKHILASYFSTHCRPHRDLIVQGLKNHGITVAGWGRCHHSNDLPEIPLFPGETQREDKQWKKKGDRQMIPFYKFHFAFDNTYTPYYHTEKFYFPFSYQTLMVYFGHETVHEGFAPHPHSFVHANSFPTIEALAKYLLYLDKNQTAYDEYFAWKKLPKGQHPPYKHHGALNMFVSNTSPCRICDYARGRLNRVFNDPKNC